MGIKHTFVANTPIILARAESLRVDRSCVESDNIRNTAGIIVDGTVPITLPTAPPYVSIKTATRMAMRKATMEEIKGFKRFVLDSSGDKSQQNCV